MAAIVYVLGRADHPVVRGAAVARIRSCEAAASAMERAVLRGTHGLERRCCSWTWS